jgi:hypothetical protein
MALFFHDVESRALDPVRSKGPEVDIWESLGNCDLVAGDFVHQDVALCIFCLVGTLLLDLEVAITEQEVPISTGVSSEYSIDVVVPLFVEGSAYFSCEENLAS